MKRIFLLLTFIGAVSVSFSQDVHLSQFYTNQQNLNPALSGKYDGAYRVVANHRNQWRQIGGEPITTAMIAFDQKVYFHSDEIDVGLIVIRDEFAAFSLATNKYMLTGSYKKVINYNELRAGFQVGLTNRSTNLSSQTFPNQWAYQDGVFDRSIDNRESTLNENQNFLDINFGLAWSKQYRNLKPTAGISLFHINSPEDSYFNNAAAKLKMRSLIHAEVLIKLPNNFSLEPRMMYMWNNKAQDALIGANAVKELDQSVVKSVYAGFLYRDGFGRISDAIIPIVGLEYKTVNVGLSYDVNVNDLSNYSSRKGTYELSVIYTAPAFVPKNLSIPCDRY